MSTLEHPEQDPDDPAVGTPAPADPAPTGGLEHSTPGTLARDVDGDGDVEVPGAPPPGDPGEEATGSEGEEGSTLERPSADDPLDAAEIAVDPERVRHAPRFGRFALVGGLLGLVAGFMLAPFARYENLNVPWHFDPWGLALVLAAMLIPVGILLGCVVALVSDRRSRRKVVR